MHKVIAHKGCTKRGKEIRGVYAYTKMYTSATPSFDGDGRIEWDSSFGWENPLYAYELLCYDCEETVLEFTDEVETYKLDHALKAYPDDYNVEIIEVDS
jgi:hypothetical protein